MPGCCQAARVKRGCTYAVLGLRRNRVFALVGVLDRDPLLAVYGLAGDQVDSGQQILLSTTSDEDTLVTMGLDDNLLAARTTSSAAPATTAATRSATTTTTAEAYENSVSDCLLFGLVG